MAVETFIMENEKIIRMSAFVAVLAIMWLWEVLAPRRALTVSKVVRWVNNLGLVFLNTFVVFLIFPIVAVGMAIYVVEHGWGILNVFELPPVVAIVVSVVVMDFIIYLQHVLVHAVPSLWRLHRVHHADLDFDVTTGSRFHPLEIILSLLIKFAVIVVLGPPVVAVVIFEVILNVSAMFNHSNIRLPLAIDRVLRWFLVTPDMHRVHHSIEDDETNSNFGFCLPWWDRLFGTYRNQPRAGHTAMTIGIRGFREMRWAAWLPGLLAIPFIGKISGYAINRRDWHAEEKKDEQS